MTLIIFFLTITIQKREINVEEAFHQEQVEKLYKQNKDRHVIMHHLL